MATKTFVLNYLKAVEKEYQQYFHENNIHIMDCISIKSDGPDTRAHVIKNTLPFDIKHEIVTMFWR
jgi:hypothetical protein